MSETGDIDANIKKIVSVLSSAENRILKSSFWLGANLMSTVTVPDSSLPSLIKKIEESARSLGIPVKPQMLLNAPKVIYQTVLEDIDNTCRERIDTRHGTKAITFYNLGNSLSCAMSYSKSAEKVSKKMSAKQVKIMIEVVVSNLSNAEKIIEKAKLPREWIALLRQAKG
jgi:hypothetical protein